MNIPSCQEIEDQLQSFHSEVRPLPGIQSPAIRCCFTQQLIDSLKRIKYEFIIREKNHAAFYADATNENFDPIKAAIWHKNNGNIDEAFWLVFLSVHFGKHKTTGWNLSRSVYGALDKKDYWNWQKISTDLKEFRQWIYKNANELKSRGKFGNHRKYETLSSSKSYDTPDTVASYIEWVGPKHSHSDKINEKIKQVGTDPNELFDQLYSELDSVIGFGRMAKFDYLTRIGKLGLANIEPDSAYLSGATGPVDGVKLLFQPNDVSTSTLDEWLSELGEYLAYPFVMQVLEDALCNWQKNPREYQQFRG